MRIRQQLAQEAYSDRNETLRLLGFKTYGAYIKSRLWQIVRERALVLNGTACRRCSRKATQVHHASYAREVLIGEDVRGLVPVCGGCHRAGSETRRGTQARKVDRLKVQPLAETNAFLAKRRLPQEKVRKGVHWCDCGKMRKSNLPACRACLRSNKPRRVKSPMERIRELSMEYAQGLVD